MSGEVVNIRYRLNSISECILPLRPAASYTPFYFHGEPSPFLICFWHITWLWEGKTGAFQCKQTFMYSSKTLSTRHCKQQNTSWTVIVHTISLLWVSGYLLILTQEWSFWINPAGFIFKGFTETLGAFCSLESKTPHWILSSHPLFFHLWLLETGAWKLFKRWSKRDVN